MGKKSRKAAMKSEISGSPPTGDMQAGPRTVNGMPLNYRAVQTLDPSRLASAFTMADQGYITEQAMLFELVEERDPHIFSELAKRRRSVTGLGWQLTPPKDATQAELDRTAELYDMLTDIPKIEDMQYDLTDAIGKGFAPIEYEWKKGDVWLPQNFSFVPQRFFQFERETGKLQYLKNGIPEDLQPNTWLVHEHKAKSGYIEQASLFRVLAWTYAYKAYNTIDMQRFLELYGLPLRLGKYPDGIGKKQRDELLRAVKNIGNDGAGVVPQSMTIEFIQAASRGTIKDFLDTLAYWESKQSKAILGGEMDGQATTDARIMVYDKVRSEIKEHDVRQLEPTLNEQLIRPIALFNGMFPEGRIPKWSYETEESVDQQKMVDVLTKGAGLGMQIPLEWAHKKMQIPQAKEGEQILKPIAVPPQTDTKTNNKNAALSRLVALMKGNEELDITTAFSSQLAKLNAPNEEKLVQQIAALVAESGDFDIAVEKLEALAIEFSPKDIAEAIALGIAAANLAGRSDVPNE